jgi:hypothetical protein
MIFKKNTLVTGLILLALSIPAVLFLLTPGFYEPHDLHHFADIYQMVRALQSGQIPPRLGPDFIFGYGYPLFNFYYLLPFYLGALWFFLVGSLTASFKFVFIVSVILSVFGMYLFLREFLGKWAALAGAALFLYTPYRALQIYVRGAMGEALGLSLLPFALWGIVRLIKKPRSKKLIAGLSLINAALILSHNYLWAMASPWVVLLALLLIKKQQEKKAVVGLISTGLLSIGLTAYWWLPALLENKLVSAKTPFLLIDHFPFIRQLIIPSWGYGSSVWGPGDEISFQIGIVNLAVVLVFLVMFIFGQKSLKKKKHLLISLWALTGFFVSVFMMNIRSYPLWKLIPYHDLIQFPWRLLMFTTLFTSILAALLIETLKEDRRKYFVILIVGVSIIFTFSYFRPSKIIYKTDNDYLARFFADRTVSGKKDEISVEYLQYSEDYLLLPNWSEEKPNSLPASKIEIIQGDGEVLGVEELNPIHFRAKITANSSLKFKLNTLFFPGWFVKSDGVGMETKPGKPFGQIEIEIPKGNHSIEFFWKETPLRKTADLVSLIFLMVTVGLLVNKGKRRPNVLFSKKD